MWRERAELEVHKGLLALESISWESEKQKRGEGVGNHEIGDSNLEEVAV
jgi:hypothetical protein